MAFGERLQEVRRAAGLTQEQFAEELNVSRQAVSRWESCRGYPEMEKLLYLCNRYGVTLNQLFSEEVPLGEADIPAPKEPPRMEEPSLRKEFRNFISNLSLRGQLSGLAVVLFTALLIVLCARGLQGGSEAMDNVMTLVWTGAVILFGIAEGLTAGLVSIWFVFGSLAALAAAFLNASLGVQVALFVLVSAVTLALTRPMVQRAHQFGPGGGGDRTGHRDHRQRRPQRGGLCGREDLDRPRRGGGDHPRREPGHSGAHRGGQAPREK